MSTANRRDGQPNKVCTYFKLNKCEYGTRCKYSHDTSASNIRGRFSHKSNTSNNSSGQHVPRQVAGARNDHRSNAREDRLHEWKRLLNRPISSSFQPKEKCNRFFPLGLELMDGDVGASQETVRLMAKEDGLAFIRALAENHIPVANTKILKSEIWISQVRPLFKLMTHPRVVDSAVLEQEVAVIYNFTQGIGGRRMKTVFNLVTVILDVWSSLPTENDPESRLAAVELSLAVLAKMIDCTASNIVNENFQPILDRLEVFIVAAGDSTDDFSKLQARKYLQYIQRRLGIGEQLCPVNIEQRSSVTRAEFVIRRDLPGRLSADGPRHNNDHADITKISILPTQEEIFSPRAEYLPSINSSLFHIPGIRGRLDREFRLLREDTIGQLRDAIRAQIDNSKNSGRSNVRADRNNLRTYTYQNASVQEVIFDKQNGLDLLVHFQQPAPAKDSQKRRDWWVQSKRLQPGGLVCAFTENSVLFCVVSEATIISPGLERTSRGKQAEKISTDQENKPCLADDAESSCVHLHIAEATPPNIMQAFRWYREFNHRQYRTLVEFPGVLLPAFQPTLQALQRMSEKPDIPFADLIAPEHATFTDVAEVPPPLYATQRDFAFDLSCLVTDGTSLRTSIRKPLNPQVLAEHTLLDTTQSRALLDTLSKSLALTQGPPGTGKSFTGEKVIKVLLANKERAKLGPILCVCYTNHALDQLLEHLHKDGVKQIIRIGSRSKSEILENLNLRVVARHADRTKAERYSLWTNGTVVESCVPEMTALIKELSGSQSERAIRDYLAIHEPFHHHSLFGKDEDGFETVHRQSNKIIDRWRRSGNIDGSDPRPIDVLKETSLWSMSRAERGRMYTHWLRNIREPIISRLVHEYKSYLQAKERQDNLRQDVDLRCLSDADIIGVTTTGLAKNLNLLRRTRCKVMLCEEAGEVLEAHTLTALLPSVEHSILIGDHQQLRPQIQNYELQSTNHRGSQYSLDISLFERLVNPVDDTHPKLPFNTLQTQRRMHPQVSELIRSTIYPSLEDGGSVGDYPMVMGMKKRLFWLHHEALEDKATQLDPSTTSHTNTFELNMTITLVQHLVRQGSYGPDDIAVITPYLGQLHRLRRMMERMFEISVGERDLEDLEALEAENSGADSPHSQPLNPPAKTTLLKSIRLATVDNFQGEEAKVVVVSLVRSNEQNKCGFLSTANRINVLLSRAQHGMYLIGNSKTYGHVPMWSKVLKILDKNQNLGTQLELQCARHPDTLLLVSQPDHFLQFAPEGGCMLPCDRRLACGHSCINRCHSGTLHNAVKCLEPCPRPKEGCDHPCRLNCGDKCEPRCNELLKGIDLGLACGHRVRNAYCWQVQNPSSITCKEIVKKTVPGCQDVVSVPCHVEVDAETYQCRAICSEPQLCGHACRSFCYQCKERADGKIKKVNHGICSQPCGRGYKTCRHACIKACHGKDCPPCSAPCEVRCSHSRCSRPCHEPCAPCANQKCASSCPHTQCSMPCAAPCDWVPCSKRCEKFLSCGHQCPSICGEPCPEARFCQVCGSSEVKETMVDFIMALQYADIDLNEDPCIFPDCGHFLTKANMDGLMDLKAYYTMSAEDNPVAVSSSSAPFSMEEVKACPTCRGSLRNVARYGRIVRRAMLDEATKKFIAWSKEEYLKLAQSLIKLQQNLSELPIPLSFAPSATRPAKVAMTNGRLKQLYLVREWVGNDRYKAMLSLWHLISAYVGKVRKEEQPFQRVAGFVQHAKRQNQGQGGEFILDETRIQVQSQLLGLALWLKCETVMLADVMRLVKEVKGPLPEIKLDLSKQLQECKTLIDLASAAMLPRQEVEGHIYFAKFCAFARGLAPEPAQPVPEEDSKESSVAEKLKADATVHTDAARKLLDIYASTKILEPEIEATEIMLRDSVFYATVSVDEMRAVYQAMAGEFRGTGHWYTCQNGHPFTVGECGMPMEQARCPECGGVVGGRNHRAADGVRHATEIDNLARGVGNMNI